MSDISLSPGSFFITELGRASPLWEPLLALQERQTRELIVGGLRGRWMRWGGETPESAWMAPTDATRRRIKRGLKPWPDHALRVEQPNDGWDDASFFDVAPSYGEATPEQRAEAGRRLLALPKLEWLSVSRWHSDRDELYDR